jgi:hypothetical protein
MFDLVANLLTFLSSKVVLVFDTVNSGSLSVWETLMFESAEKEDEKLAKDFLLISCYISCDITENS